LETDVLEYAISKNDFKQRDVLHVDVGYNAVLNVQSDN
jgi:hypothetical protein